MEKGTIPVQMQSTSFTRSKPEQADHT